MKIERNLLNKTSNIYTESTQPTVRELGRYQITAIEDTYQSLIVYLHSHRNPKETFDPRYDHHIRIYVDKEKFRASFAAGDDVILYIIPPTEHKDIMGGITVSDMEEYFINMETLVESEHFYPWDPYW